MNGKTHQLIGVTASIAASTVAWKFGYMGIPAYLSMIAGSCFGSYLPDIDHPGSTLGRRVKIVSKPINAISQFFLSIYNRKGNRVALWLGEFFGHRGIFHSPLLWVALMVPLCMTLLPAISAVWLSAITTGLLIGISIGIGMHLFADMFNPTGVPLFAPLTFHKFSIGNIITGSKKERIVIALCFGMIVLNIGTVIFFVSKGV